MKTEQAISGTSAATYKVMQALFHDFTIPPYAVAGIRTHVSSVAPTRDLLKDALPTESLRRGMIFFFGEEVNITSDWLHLVPPLSCIYYVQIQHLIRLT